MRLRALVTKRDDAVPLGRFTVLVGANNVGKSQTLRDIHRRIVEGPQARTTIVETLEIEKPPSLDSFLAGLESTEDPANPHQHILRGIGPTLTGGDQLAVQLEELGAQFLQSADLQFVLGGLGRFRVALLDASSRLSVALTADSHNPSEQPPNNLLQGLFMKPSLETPLRSAFKETFGQDLKLDYSGMRTLTLRVAPEFGEVPLDPRDAYPVLRSKARLDDQGDGYRSFVGVVLSLLLSEGRVVLLDEPEAFLHPAQSRRLGEWIARNSKSAVSQVIVATHNASFLAGILESGVDVDIYRVRRTNDRTQFRRISSDTTRTLTSSPVLSSQRVLEAVFYRGVVICEADADRALYQAVASRHLRNQEVLFIHAHNKQTVPVVAQALIDMHVPVAGVMDFDLLNSKDEFARTLTTFAPGHSADFQEERDAIALAVEGRPDDEVLAGLVSGVRNLADELERGEHNLPGARGAMNRVRRESTKWALVKHKGTPGLPEEVQAVSNSLLSRLANVGVFVVPVGELESWMPDIGRTKGRWIVSALKSVFEGQIPPALVAFVESILAQLEAQASNES